MQFAHLSVVAIFFAAAFGQAPPSPRALDLKTITDPGIDRLSKALKEDRKSCTEARAKLLDHYESVLRILDDLGKLLYPKGSGVPTDNPEGKMLMRILVSSCADTFDPPRFLHRPRRDFQRRIGWNRKP